MGSRKYCVVGHRKRPKGPILIAPRNQEFSLYFNEQPPQNLEASRGQIVEGSIICEQLKNLWEGNQLNDQKLLRLDGSTERVEEITDLDSDMSTHAAAFIQTPYSDEGLFICHVQTYMAIVEYVRCRRKGMK